MIQMIGEFDCKLDAKGRMVVPAALKRQLPDIEREGLVVNRGFEKNLAIYPKSQWEKEVRKLSALNQYKKENREFVRMFMRGATPLNLDSAGRVLLPKSLLDYAGINGEIVLACNLDKIEVWSKGVYDAMMTDDLEGGFAELAERVMSGRQEGGLDE